MSTPHPDPDPSLSRAVLIGVGDYRTLGAISSVENNLPALAQALCTDDLWGLPSGNCVVVENPKTTAEMLDPLVEAAQGATDTLLLYYVGHGLVDRRSELHLALVGSSPDPQRMYTAVPYSHIRDIILDSPAYRRIVILDCCYSGRALGQMADPVSAMIEEASAEGTFVLAAAAENRVALAPPGAQYTAFTGELLSIINDGITGHGPLLDLDSIYHQLRAVMVSKGLPVPQRRDRNTASQLTLIRNRAFQHTEPEARKDLASSAESVVPRPDATHCEVVLEHMVEEGSLVLFLGSQLTPEVTAELAERFGVKSTLNLSKVAQHIYLIRGRVGLYRTLRQILSADSAPKPIHRFLARLPRTLEELRLPKQYQLIVSMSFDRALEQAFDDEGEPYDLAIYMASGPDRGKFVHFPWGDAPKPIAVPNAYERFPFRDFGELERTVILKINGAVDGHIGDYRWKENYVITEDDYINYLSRASVESLIPVQILEKLRDSHCLFLGCTVSDWEQRVFLNRVWRAEPLGARSWAVEPDPDILDKHFWERFYVELYAADMAEYVTQLHERLTRRAQTSAQP